MLSINFLSPAEIKNPAVKLLRTTGFAALGGIAAGVALYILFVFTQLQSAKSSFENAKTAEANLQNSYHDALKLRDNIKHLMQMKDELIAFSNAQIRLSEKLVALAECVPETVQLIDFEINQELKNIQPSNPKLQPVASRHYYGTIQGRVSPEHGEADYRAFLEKLQSLHEAQSFGTVSPGGYDPEKNNNKKEGMPDYILTINLDFEPRAYSLNSTKLNSPKEVVK